MAGIQGKHYVIVYDVADDKRRSLVVRALKDVGYRVQYSVFEAELTSEALIRLRMRIDSVIRRSNDSVIYYARCGHCRDDVIRDGIAPAPLDDEDLYFI